MNDAWYNENDPRTAAWLRELIVAGKLPEGDVNADSIEVLKSSDITAGECHFFAGIGGWPYALQLAGWPEDQEVWTGSCPCQPFSCAGKQLGTADKRHLWPVWYRLIAERRPATIFGEQVASKAGREWFAGVRTDLEALGYAVGCADLCAASVGAPHIRQRLFWVADANLSKDHTAEPLQLLSSAGRGSMDRDGGTGGAACGVGITGEQGLEGHAGDERDGDQPGRLDSQAAGPVGAAGWTRVTFAADCDEDGNCPNCGVDFAECECPGPTQDGYEYQEINGVMYARREGFWSDYALIHCRDGKQRRTQPGLFPLAHGVSARVVRLRGFGNAIVPQVAAAFITAARAAKGMEDGKKAK